MAQSWTGAITVADDPINQRTSFVVGGGADGTFGNLSASSLKVGNLLLEQQPVVTTTAAETKNLLQSALIIPNGQLVAVRAIVKGTITSANTLAPFYLGMLGVFSAMGGTATIEEATVTAEALVDSPPFGGSVPTNIVTGTAANGGGNVRLTVNTVGMSSSPTVIVSGVAGTTEANGTWRASVASPTQLDLPVAFVHAFSASSGTVQVLGNAGLVTTGANTVQIQATGITPAAYRNSEALAALALVEANGNSYMVTRAGAGTTSNSGTGPSGTGTGIVNGGATLDYVSAGPGVPITWQVVRLEIL